MNNLRRNRRRRLVTWFDPAEMSRHQCFDVLEFHITRHHQGGIRWDIKRLEKISNVVDGRRCDVLVRAYHRAMVGVPWWVERALHSKVGLSIRLNFIALPTFVAHHFTLSVHDASRHAVEERAHAIGL